jgi:hypothetical protein
MIHDWNILYENSSFNVAVLQVNWLREADCQEKNI